MAGLTEALLVLQLPMSSARKKCQVSGIPTNKTRSLTFEISQNSFGTSDLVKPLGASRGKESRSRSTDKLLEVRT